MNEISSMITGVSRGYFLKSRHARRYTVSFYGSSRWRPSIDLVLVVINSKSNWLYGFVDIHLSFYVVLFIHVGFEIADELF